MTIRAAILGGGFQGRLHAECLRALDDVQLVAVCDLDEARLAAMQENFGVVHGHTDYRELLERHDLDIVTVCTMAALHRDMTVAALEHGAHVLCEKPFARTTAEAVEMAEAARRADRLLGVGFNMRWFGASMTLKRLIEDGTLGRPVCARGWMLADDVPWWGRHYVRGLSGGGALASTAVHMLDLILWLAGSPRPLTASASMATLFPGKRAAGAPAGAAAEYDTEDLIFGHVRCADDFWLSIEGAWVWEGSGWNYSCDLVGERAQARLDPLDVRGERDGVPASDLLPPGAAADTDFPTSVARELADFVAAVRGEKELVVRLDQALAVQAVTDALYRSAELGREVAVELP